MSYNREKLLYCFIYRADNKKIITKPIVSLYLANKELDKLQLGFSKVELKIGKVVVKDGVEETVWE